MADRDNDRIGDLIAESLVYDIDIVDADNEKRTFNFIAAAVIQCLVERFAQSGFVEMPGEFIIIHQILDFVPVGFLLTDRAQSPTYPADFTVGVKLRRAPVMIPMVIPVGIAKPEFALEGRVLMV